MFLGTGKPLKPREHARARELRTQGWSYKRIAAELSISPSSALNWTRDIQLTRDQIALNLGKGTPAARELVAKRGRAWSAECRRRRERFQLAGREQARSSDALHQAGCMLYWAEGAKDKNRVRFANSDAAMVRFFVQFLRNTFQVPDADIAVQVNVYLGNGHGIDDVHRYWLDELQLPATCLRKPTTNHFPTSSSGLRRDKLPFGVCTVSVLRSTWLVQHIFGAIQEYADFEEPRWLG